MRQRRVLRTILAVLLVASSMLFGTHVVGGCKDKEDCIRSCGTYRSVCQLGCDRRGDCADCATGYENCLNACGE